MFNSAHAFCEHLLYVLARGCVETEGLMWLIKGEATITTKCLLNLSPSAVIAPPLFRPLLGILQEPPGLCTLAPTLPPSSTFVFCMSELITFFIENLDNIPITWQGFLVLDAQ